MIPAEVRGWALYWEPMTGEPLSLTPETFRPHRNSMYIAFIDDIRRATLFIGEKP